MRSSPKPHPQTSHFVILKEPSAIEESQRIPRSAPDDMEGDRLSRVLFHANELNDSRLRKIKTSWTPARRKKQSLQIQRVKPWKSSTGPKTATGKARSARNAQKGSAVLRYADRALREQARFVRQLSLAHRLKMTGKLSQAAEIEAECRRIAPLVTARLRLVVALAALPVTERNNE